MFILEVYDVSPHSQRQAGARKGRCTYNSREIAEMGLAGAGGGHYTYTRRYKNSTKAGGGAGGSVEGGPYCKLTILQIVRLRSNPVIEARVLTVFYYDAVFFAALSIAEFRFAA